MTIIVVILLIFSIDIFAKLYYNIINVLACDIKNFSLQKSQNRRKV